MAAIGGRTLLFDAGHDRAERRALSLSHLGALRTRAVLLARKQFLGSASDSLLPAYTYITGGTIGAALNRLTRMAPPVTNSQ